MIGSCCYGCGYDLKDRELCSVIETKGEPPRIYCEACTVVGMLEAEWQKAHAERTE